MFFVYLKETLHPFHATGLFLYPLVNQTFFDLLKRVSNETSGMKWVEILSKKYYFH